MAVNPFFMAFRGVRLLFGTSFRHVRLRLSQTPGFEYFQNVVLVSCHSDSYGPFDSARVEIGSMLGMHTAQEAYKEIVQNLWRNATG